MLPSRIYARRVNVVFTRTFLYANYRTGYNGNASFVFLRHGPTFATDTLRNLLMFRSVFSYGFLWRIAHYKHNYYVTAYFRNNRASSRQQKRVSYAGCAACAYRPEGRECGTLHARVPAIGICLARALFPNWGWEGASGFLRHLDYPAYGCSGIETWSIDPDEDLWISLTFFSRTS